jgi:hypothetical protein
MNNLVYLLSALLVVMLLCIVFLGEKVIAKSDPSEALEGLEGLWVGHDRFYADADIDGMILYLGKCINGSITAVLIMHAEDVTIAYKKFEINLKTGMLGKVITGGNTKKMKMEADLEELDLDDETQTPLSEIIPEHVCITYQPYKCSLQIYEYLNGKKNIYADLIKDNVSATDL